MSVREPWFVAYERAAEAGERRKVFERPVHELSFATFTARFLRRSHPNDA